MCRIRVLRAMQTSPKAGSKAPWTAGATAHRGEWRNDESVSGVATAGDQPARPQSDVADATLASLEGGWRGPAEGRRVYLAELRPLAPGARRPGTADSDRRRPSPDSCAGRRVAGTELGAGGAVRSDCGISERDPEPGCLQARAWQAA